MAGIKHGDLIIKMDGKNIRSGMDIRLTVLEIPVGKEFEVELIRVEKGGIANKMVVKVTLQNKP